MQKISDGRPSDAGKPFAFVRREARTCSKVGGPCGRRPDTEQSSASGPCVALDLIALKHPSISVLNCETVQSDNHNLDCVCLRADARKRGRFCVGLVTGLRYLSQPRAFLLHFWHRFQSTLCRLTYDSSCADQSSIIVTFERLLPSSSRSRYGCFEEDDTKRRKKDEELQDVQPHEH